MNDLQRHIEILLLENECVVVPDFGGFMTHHVHACYDAENHLMFPPQRTLGFNPQLRMNDSTLVQSYVEAYDISYPEALRQVAEDVEEMKHTLECEGSYTLNNLGTLTVNQEGNYEFTPCEAGILCPEYYGLGTVELKQLNDLQTDNKPVKAAEVIELPQTNSQEEVAEEPNLIDIMSANEQQDDDTVHIKSSWVRNAVAIAAAITAFFLLSTPIVNSEMGTRTMSHLQSNIIYKLMPKDSNKIPAEPVKMKVDQKKEVKVQPEKPAVTTETVSKAMQPTYYIVLASQVKKSNAEYFVQKLQQDGFADAKVLVTNKIVRVVCGEFSSEAEAYRQLNQVSTKPGFEEAWVLKYKAEV